MTTEGALTATHFDQLWAMLMTEDKELKPIVIDYINLPDFQGVLGNLDTDARSPSGVLLGPVVEFEGRAVGQRRSCTAF
jgi:hypothetical protein